MKSYRWWWSCLISVFRFIWFVILCLNIDLFVRLFRFFDFWLVWFVILNFEFCDNLRILCCSLFDFSDWSLFCDFFLSDANLPPALSKPVLDRSGPVQDRSRTGPVLSPSHGPISVFGPGRAGQVRSWTNAHPYKRGPYILPSKKKFRSRNLHIGFK